MDLYGSYTSPFVRHCRIALLESGLPFEFHETDYTVSAQKSPSKKVPFLQDDAVKLFDSASILRHIRTRAHQPFMATTEEYDQFLLVNTSLDALVNLFLLGKEGVTPENNGYLARQKARVDSSLAHLNSLPLPSTLPLNDAQLRLACYLGWIRFRDLIDLQPYPNLVQLLTLADTHAAFAETAPPSA
ncbi:glutathione S-transferase family protein [Salinispirillum marinum]|uniref:Glutathione S-transferase family protein n=2 Tax=Saccharospirillaceae TaxID=255527 RepID=A0ABV8BE67_9GAMM